MRFNKRYRSVNKLCDFVTSIAITFALAGCVSTQSRIKMEPMSVANRLGLPNCKVSIPMSESEVVDNAKRDGVPNPEKNQEWIEMTKSLQPRDQLRLVSCKYGNPYFYALIRNEAVILKFRPLLF
jgi:hypothetical protein